MDVGVPNGWATRYFNRDTDNNNSGNIGVRAYADGLALRSSHCGASRVARPESDLGFKTYVTPSTPTSKSQCKKGGWRDVGIFKNRGDCVSFVATAGKNPPSGSPSAATKGHRSKPR